MDNNRSGVDLHGRLTVIASCAAVTLPYVLQWHDATGATLFTIGLFVLTVVGLTK